MKKSFAVFFSGYGRGASQLVNDYANGYIKPEFKLLVSLNPEAPLNTQAIAHGIEVLVICPEEYNTNDELDEILAMKLSEKKIDYIFLAGYGKLIGSTLLSSYENKIANIHPSLLPAFKGHKNGIQQALEYGVKVTGVTTHWVDSGMDSGTILMQESINIDNDDFKQLEYRVYHLGCTLQLKTINTFFI